jgi:hypothetical protein
MAGDGRCGVVAAEEAYLVVVRPGVEVARDDGRERRLAPVFRDELGEGDDLPAAYGGGVRLQN